MKPEELRIGNITDKGTVKSFHETGIHVGFGKTYEFNDCSPVKLTEEWLEKFGFEIHSDYSYRNFILPRNNFIISMWMGDGQPGGFEEIGVCYWGEMYIGIRTVHHLQNIFHALTGTELEIKD